MKFELQKLERDLNSVFVCINSKNKIPWRQGRRQKIFPRGGAEKKDSKKNPKNSTIKPLYLLYLYHVWKSPCPPLPTPLRAELYIFHCKSYLKSMDINSMNVLYRKL